MIIETDSMHAWLERYEVQLPSDQVEELDAFCTLLWEFNQNLNLTRHTDYEKFVTRDVTDSLEIAKLLESGESILDVGSGGGVPGIPLSIMRKDLKVHLSESTGKKAKVLAEIISRLQLDVPVFADRAENAIQAIQVSTLVARAVGPIWKILKWFEPHWSRFDRILLIKGPKWLDERGEARHRGFLKPLDLRRVHSYPVPNLDSESVVLSITKKS